MWSVAGTLVFLQYSVKHLRALLLWMWLPVILIWEAGQAGRRIYIFALAAPIARYERAAMLFCTAWGTLSSSLSLLWLSWLYGPTVGSSLVSGRRRIALLFRFACQMVIMGLIGNRYVIWCVAFVPGVRPKHTTIHTVHINAVAGMETW